MKSQIDLGLAIIGVVAYMKYCHWKSNGLRIFILASYNLLDITYNVHTNTIGSFINIREILIVQMDNNYNIQKGRIQVAKHFSAKKSCKTVVELNSQTLGKCGFQNLRITCFTYTYIIAFYRQTLGNKLWFLNYFLRSKDPKT